MCKFCGVFNIKVVTTNNFICILSCSYDCGSVELNFFLEPFKKM